MPAEHPVLRASRNWGNEYLIHLVPNAFSVKILEIKRGHKGGLQSHFYKNEFGLVLSGRLVVRSGYSLDSLSEMLCERGSTFAFEPGLIHQEEALDDVIVYEVSTPHFNDRRRFDHSEASDNFLESTSPSDVLYVDVQGKKLLLEKYGFLPCITGDVSDAVLEYLTSLPLATKFSS